MNKWISAARLRTLPLALSSIFMGGFLAEYTKSFNISIFLLAVLTTVLLQVLSNFANDYGDTQNGADLIDRIGPTRAVQTGEIKPKQMMTAIILMAILSFVSGVILLCLSFGFATVLFWKFILIGVFAIIAAYTYTAGKKPYGYLGLGDLSVFIFFGLVGVLGSYSLYNQTFNCIFILPAVACGCLATGVLNLNNIRDINSDAKAGKNTIPVKLGRTNAIYYHWLLLSIAVVSTLVFVANCQISKPLYLFILPLIIYNGIKVKLLQNPDPLLKSLALTSLAYVVLLGLSLIL